MPGGAVGLFGYDLVRAAEPAVGEPNPDELGTPDLALMVSDVLLAFDHFKHEVTVLANVFSEEGIDDAELERRYTEAVAAIADARAAGGPGAAGHCAGCAPVGLTPPAGQERVPALGIEHRL